MMRDLCIIAAFLILKASGQCVFPSPFASSTWLDNKHGTLTFGTTSMTGWSATIFNQAINSWECLDNSSSTTLVMRATQSVTWSSNAIYAFLCMQLTQITTNSYSYYQQQVPQPNAGFERLWFSADSTLSDVATICNTAVSLPTLEFHVLVKQGMAESAAITFPNKLLFSGDYQYMTSDGTIACNTTGDTMDMCTDTTALSFNNYTICQQEIAYSAGGELWCVAKASLDSYDCAVVFNRDATISGTASQFACLCSDGSSVSVVSGNCTSDQTANSYPTAADGTTVIGYQLSIQSVYVNCVPTESSSSSGLSGGVIAAIVIVILIIIIVVVSIILYKRGHCVAICDRVNGCLGKTPCWAACRSKVCVCCKNKVDGAEMEKPMITNGVGPHAEIINETSKRPKLLKDKTSMSAITRSSSMAGTREKSELEKSLQRQATTTSIGIDMKSERSSSIHMIKVKSKDGDDEKEPRFKVLGLNLSFLVCCPEKKEIVKSVTVVEPEKPGSPEKKKAAGKGAGKKGAKGKGGKGGGKGGKKEKKATDVEKDLEKNGDVTLTEVENGQLTRAPTKMKSDLLLTSTPVPGGERGQKGIVSVPAGLLKPKDKATEWTFLACCFGNRSPPPTEEEYVEEPEPKKKANTKSSAKGKPGAAKKEGGGTKKAGKKGGKGKGKAKDVNENTLIEEDLTEEKPAYERSKTLPEREKTTLSLQDAEHVKVDVYVPTGKLKLKDTVIKGPPQLEKSKTDAGVVRPPSSRPASSVKGKGGKGKAEKKGNKKADKDKKGSKDKKGAKKKKK